MIGSTLASALSGTANPEKWLIEAFGGGSRTASGERINEHTALTCAAVLAAVKILAETVAQLPLDVFRRLPNGDKIPAPDHPVHKLLHTEPNEETSSFIWRETLQGHLGTWGNGYASIQRAADRTPTALWQRSPKPQHTKPFRREEDGKLWYRLRNDAGVEDLVPARDMLHIPGLSFDGLTGYSPVSLMKEAIGLNKGAERYASELFDNDAGIRGLITLEGELSEPAYKRTRDAFNASGHGSRHKIQILEGGATFASTQMNPTDVQMIEARRFSVEEVARAYRISLHLLQEFTEGAASYASIVELGREFIDFTMIPWLRRWEDELNRKLLSDGDFFCEFNTAAFLRGDAKSRAEIYFKGFQVGLYSINDMLRLENKNPIGPEGDVRFVPMNLTPVERAIKGPPDKPPPAAPPAPAPPPEDEPEPDSDEPEEQRALPMPVVHARLDRLEEAQLETTNAVDEVKQMTEEQVSYLLSTLPAILKIITDASLTACEAHDAILLVTGKRSDQIDAMLVVINTAVASCSDGQAEKRRLGALAWNLATRDLLVKEGKAAEREAAKGGNFLDWMNEFYDGHAGLCEAKFEVAALALCIPAKDLAARHIEQSTEALLAATECRPEELTERVAACVADWGQRHLLIGDTDVDNHEE